MITNDMLKAKLLTLKTLRAIKDWLKGTEGRQWIYELYNGSTGDFIEMIVADGAVVYIFIQSGLIQDMIEYNQGIPIDLWNLKEEE